MAKKKLIIPLILLLTLSFFSFATAEEANPRLLIHILDYLAQDYGGAVSHGKVLNPFEYQEQVEFVETALKTAHQWEKIRKNPALLEELGRLQKLISEKDSPENVSSLARKIQSELIDLSQIEIAPKKWPSLAQGKTLFAQNCSTCHGVSGKGDGPLAQTLKPSPANFWNESRMSELSAFQVFNTIRLGVEGTPMPPFQHLKDEEIWDLAFYVLSLRHQNVPNLRLNFPLPSLSLEELAVMSDQAILHKYHWEGEKSILDLLRSQDQGKTNSLNIAKKFLGEAETNYLKGDLSEAQHAALMAYLEGVEPVEPRLRSLDSQMVRRLEEKMALLRTSLAQDKAEKIQFKIKEVQSLISEAELLLSSSSSKSQWFVFVMALSIILREGFEAVLILVTILGVARAMGAKKAVRWTHAGWITALFLGLLTWFFSGFLLNMSGAKRETMEGFTSLFAVMVLLYVGFWLHSKSEITRWTVFIKTKMDSALKGSKLLGIGMISFVAVFREVFETVLFLRALWLEGGASEKRSLLGGVGLAFLAIFLFAYFLLKFSVKLPITKLFNLSSLVMVLLAIILTGKGLRALQEAGYISASALSIPLHFPFFGVYPTFETLASQAIILVLVILLWNYGKKASST